MVSVKDHARLCIKNLSDLQSFGILLLHVFSVIIQGFHIKYNSKYAKTMLYDAKNILLLLTKYQK
jgi:hypothetical protein